MVDDVSGAPAAAAPALPDEGGPFLDLQRPDPPGPFGRFLEGLVKARVVFWIAAPVVGAAAITLGSRQLFLLFIGLVAAPLALKVLGRDGSSSVLSRLVGRRRLRFTNEGRIYILVTLGFGVAAINTGTNLLYLILGMLLSFIVVSGILSETCFQRVGIRRTTPPYVFANEPFRVEVVLGNQKRFWPSYALVIEEGPVAHLAAERGGVATFLVVPPGGVERRTYRARFARRGVHRFGAITVRTRYPFGFFEKYTDVPVDSEVVVYPELRELVPGLAALAAPSHDETRSRRPFFAPESTEEFRGLREYREGDNPRSIHWRSSARHAKLLVKEHERFEPRAVLVVVDAVGPLDDVLEAVLGLAASVADSVYRANARVGFAVLDRTGVTVSAPDAGSRALYGLLERLARYVPVSAADAAGEPLLGELARRSGELRGARTVVVTRRTPAELSAAADVAKCPWVEAGRVLAVGQPEDAAIFYADGLRPVLARTTGPDPADGAPAPATSPDPAPAALSAAEAAP